MWLLVDMTLCTGHCALCSVLGVLPLFFSDLTGPSDLSCLTFLSLPLPFSSLSRIRARISACGSMIDGRQEGDGDVQWTEVVWWVTGRLQVSAPQRRVRSRAAMWDSTAGGCADEERLTQCHNQQECSSRERRVPAGM